MLMVVFRLLWPALIIEAALVALNWFVLPTRVLWMHYAFLFVSLAVLPFFVGWRLRAINMSPTRCALWGPVISLVSLLGAAIAATLGRTSWGEYLAFFIVTAFIVVGPQILFSFLGAKYGNSLFRTTA
ncbi:hypothetical protein [Methylobacillus sp. MM3]|uniref:hypothetical protein n=1 Tax=Methylobacillus sp. MM3 TaxID=1848039 RepID=UPI001041E136|nr:hypothetical protein [Methylobacillus sp. MM3]